MNILLFGDCEKQELATFIAISMMQAGNSTTIIPDTLSDYHGLESISGINLNNPESEVKIFDSRHLLFPSDLRIFVTDGSNKSLNSIRSLKSDTKDIFVYLDSGSKTAGLNASSFVRSHEIEIIPTYLEVRDELMSSGLAKSKMYDKAYDDLLADLFMNKMNKNSSDAKNIIRLVRGALV